MPRVIAHPRFHLIKFCARSGRSAGARRTRSLRSRSILLCLGAASVMAPVALSFDEALARCTAADRLSPYICSGANTTTQTINDYNVLVNTTPGFSVNTAASQALNIFGFGTQTYADSNGSPLTSRGTDFALTYAPWATSF
ncbi:hypothetical protein [Bradyrhizobium sp. 1]|uniref:hypothetical protein n=1 Tax=Bradyrhizobium sp. 1 TaxID=241591 RepID=UPI001FFB22DA|nr:hypothetical protein [Bradyrhizobium sp. 1]MCK1393934.1 hypothetical protein [Bradyrhizobium sp. 1]